MINKPVIKQEVFGEVGFKQSIDPEYAVVDSDNQVTRSGLTFQGGNNIVSIRNIKETQEFPGMTTDQLNTYLKELQEECILDVVGKIFQDKSRLLETKTLFPYEQDFSDTVELEDGFVGIEIQPPLSDCVLFHLNSIGLSFDGVVSLPIHIKNSEIPESIFETTIDTKANQTVTEKIDFGFSLNGTAISGNDTYRNLGGKYYLGYYTSDLGGVKPYKRNFELATLPIYSNYMGIEFRNMNVDGTRINPNNPESIEDPYGLNINYSVYTDFTDKIIQNKHLFARAIQLQMTEKVANLILTNTRTNAVESSLKDNIRQLAGFVIEGGEKSLSIAGKIQREINSLKKMLFPKPRIMKGTLT